MPVTTLPSSSRLDRQDALALVRRLVTEYGLAQWKRYAFAFVLMAVGAGSTAAAAYLMGDMLNEGFAQRNFAGVVQISVLILAVFTLRGLSIYGQAVLLQRIGNAIVAQNQRRVFEKLMAHSLAFFAERHSSEFIARLTTGANAATQILNLLITAVGRDLLTVIGLVIVMAMQDPVLSICALLIAPPAAFMIRKLTKRVRTVAYNQWTGGAQALETMQEALQGLRIVKAFTMEPAMRARFETNVAMVEGEANKMARVGQRVHPIMETLGGLALTLVMIYAGYRVIYTGATPGEFFSFMTAFLFAYEPAKRLARLNIDLNAVLVGVRILFEIIDAKSTEPDESDRPALVPTRARVEFAHVRFAYRDDVPVYRDLSFVAEPGQVTALVGPSGGGKSTILNLIMRFYEIDAGTIAIDGQGIDAVARHSLRQQIAYVGQDVFLFRASIRENIAFGKPGASEAEIVAAAKAAHAHDFISNFPDGYDTQVGEHGHRLSGGERQRVAIARALIKNAPIILLDEATAALDAASERHVQEALAELCKGRTTIVIAHRLSTIMHADRILVIEAGEV
ncbi:MAG: ATP-binding cassette, subfamily bacterial MsbA, partial [Alphaproteobacteria bacterium]|nr:ATP-binding cassette, subfamily bacterial MsbA [Alphaproteobacteria bacterium]